MFNKTVKKAVAAGLALYATVQTAAANVITTASNVTSFDVSGVIGDIGLVGAGMIAVAATGFGIRKVVRSIGG